MAEVAALKDKKAVAALEDKKAVDEKQAPSEQAVALPPKPLTAAELKKKGKSSFDVLAAESAKEAIDSHAFSQFETSISARIRFLQEQREAAKKEAKDRTRMVRQEKRKRATTIKKINKLNDTELMLACDLRAEAKRRKELKGEAKQREAAALSEAGSGKSASSKAKDKSEAEASKPTSGGK